MRASLIASLAVLGWVAAAAGQDRAPTGQPKPPGPVAVVNGEPIAYVDWLAALGRLPPPPPGFPPQQIKAVHQELLGLMVDEKLLMQFLAKATPEPAAAEVDAKIAEVEKGMKLRQTTLAAYLRDTRQTAAQFRAGVAAELRWQAHVGQRIAGADLKAYYEANKEMFDGVAIRVSHIVIAVPPNAEPQAVQAATEKLKALRAELAKGADFAAAAKLHSGDKASGQNGGDLGYFPPRKADPDPFIRAASALKVGELSDLVRTDFGLHLIKQTERKGGTPSQFEPMKDAVRTVWSDELKVAVILEQRKAAKITINLPE